MEVRTGIAFGEEPVIFGRGGTDDGSSACDRAVDVATGSGEVHGALYDDGLVGMHVHGTGTEDSEIDGVSSATLAGGNDDGGGADLPARGDVGDSDVSDLATGGIEDGDEAGVVALGFYIGEVEILG